MKKLCLAVLLLLTTAFFTFSDAARYKSAMSKELAPQGPKPCPGDCTSPANGLCVNGTCQCFGSYFGDSCERSECKNNCSGLGYCKDNQCFCDNGHTGDDCSIIRQCPIKCHPENGICRVGKIKYVRAECECKDNWKGPSCETPVQCGVNCAEHGKCVDGFCICDIGWFGADCEQELCKKNCSFNGVCAKNGCACFQGFMGDMCQFPDCRNKCVHGTCSDGACICDDGWAGQYCDSMSCPNNCGGPTRGHCNNGTCVCDPRYSGVGCEVRECKNKCNYHGTCKDGVCQCFPRFFGDDCSINVEFRRQCSVCCVNVCLQQCAVAISTQSRNNALDCYSRCTGSCNLECALDPQTTCKFQNR